MHSSRFVITGGPGSGKTSLVNALASMGYTVFEEVSRRLIREQVSLKDGVLPWKDMARFAELAMGEMTRQYEESHQIQVPCFFDRGIPDIGGYLSRAGLPVTEPLRALYQTHVYDLRVFICPPWNEIYENDPERPQKFNESVELYYHIHREYQQLGYNMIEIPKGDLLFRVSFIQKMIGNYEVVPYEEK